MKIGEFEMFTTVTNIIKKYYNGRDIVVIGDNTDFADFLVENGLTVRNIYPLTEEESAEENTQDNAEPAPSESNEKSAASDEEVSEDAADDKNDPLRAVKQNELNASDCYLLFTELKKDKEYCTVLESLGFTDFNDYVFANHGRILVRAGTVDYNDEYGNVIHCKNCKVFLNDFCCNVRINVDDSAVFGDKCYISARHLGCSEVNIGPECRFVDNVSLVVAGDGKLTIGQGTKIVMNSGIVVLEGHDVTIGERCLISYDVKIYSGDGHAIFDSVTQDRLNPPVESTKNKIILGDYVWVGMRAVILNYCNIGNGSIIGASSVVKGTYPNNCAIGGNPARLLRKNVIWSENYKDDTFEECPELYVNPTEEL